MADVPIPDETGPGLATGQPLRGITVPGTGHVPVSVEVLDTGERRVRVGSESALVEASDADDLADLLRSA